MATETPSVETDVSLLTTVAGESSYRTVNGNRLHTVVAGDEADPLVVLLHGFPEFWYGWHAQIEPLVEAGYRVLVPDQRGYNLSDRPQSVRAYRVGELSQDIVDLVESEGCESAHIVGHDWGGAIAWDLARRHPAVVDRLVIANAPHPTAFTEQLRSNPTQLRRSWYVFWFQLPWVPEAVVRATDLGVLEGALRETSAPGTFSDAELAHYRRAWKQEGALTGMINWYRAIGRYPPSGLPDRVDQPTLIIWGVDDTALVPALALEGYRHCRNGRLELLEGTSHWVQHERPGRVTELLCEHLDGRH